MVSRMSCVLMRSNFDFKEIGTGMKSKNKSNDKLLNSLCYEDKEAQKFEEMFSSMEEVSCSPYNLFTLSFIYLLNQSLEVK